MSKVYAVYSDYGDEFVHSHLSDFIIDNELYVGHVIKEGVSIKPLPSNFFDVDTILDNANEQACGECGDYSKSFANLSKEKRDEFEKLIHDWVDKNIEVDFFVVEDIKEIVITENMLGVEWE